MSIASNRASARLPVVESRDMHFSFLGNWGLRDAPGAEELPERRAQKSARIG
jgi:hypothetical protein